MKQNILILILLFSNFVYLAQSKKPAVYFMVSGKITKTSSYCGGMAPSEEIMAEMMKASPNSGKVLYLRQGAVNDLKKPIVMKIVADSLGKFVLMLKPGVYSIILPEQLKPLDLKKLPIGPNIVADKNCLREWWKKPYFLLEIKDKSIEGLEFNFNRRCFIEGDVPCLNYTGPLPP